MSKLEFQNPIVVLSWVSEKREEGLAFFDNLGSELLQVWWTSSLCF